MMALPANTRIWIAAGVTDLRRAHVRRHFYDLEQAHSSSVAREALQRIGALYGVEEEIRAASPPRCAPDAIETTA